MSIAGHVSRAMLSRYSHVRMEAKRRALDEIAARQRAADEKRKQEAERLQQSCDGLLDLRWFSNRNTTVKRGHRLPENGVDVGAPPSGGAGSRCPDGESNRYPVNK